MVDLNLGDTRLIIGECSKQGVLRNQAAYILATAFWETARTMKPVREYGGEKYLKSKRYYPHVGMGYVQLTWRENYQKASEKLGVDFVSDPRKLLIPEYAKTILVLGMIEGWFTGKSLSDYITLQKSDFINARRIINGVDRKREIADIAKDYDQALIDIGYGVTSDGTNNIPPVYPKPKPPSVEVPPAPSPNPKPTFLSILAAFIGRLFRRS